MAPVGAPAGSGLDVLTDQRGDVLGDFSPTGSAPGSAAAYDPLGDVIATQGAKSGPLGYQGAYTGPGGLLAMGARSYSPATGANPATLLASVGALSVPTAGAAQLVLPLHTLPSPTKALGSGLWPAEGGRTGATELGPIADGPGGTLAATVGFSGVGLFASTGEPGWNSVLFQGAGN